MKLNQYKLLLLVKKELNCTFDEAKKSLKAFSKVIKDQLLQGNQVRFDNLGTFSLLSKKAKRYVNPKTRELMTIPAMIVVKFKQFNSMRKVFDTK